MSGTGEDNAMSCHVVTKLLLFGMAEFRQMTDGIQFSAKNDRCRTLREHGLFYNEDDSERAKNRMI